MPPRTDIPTHRLSASVLPPEVEPAERDFMRLLEKALAPSYTLVKRLGAGGMGAVYLARDPVLRRLVAVKVMSPALAADPAARARFEREAQAVASISHPNVVAVYSVGELENGVPFLVMQYIDGRSMAERLAQDGPLEAPAAKRVIGEVASALAAAHRKGIIHRDIKPANILLDEDTGRAMVTDFGIAAVLERADEREAVRITHTGMAIGTPAYMSPEQLLAEPVTEKTDIYSLGLLGYELFIAEGPYQISSPREVMAAHLRDTPRKLSTMRADVDPELERLLESCLAKDPAKRPSSAEVETRLQHGASILLEWPPPGLERARSGLRTAVRVLLAGGLGAGIPIVLVSVFDRDSVVRQLLPPTGFVLAVTCIGMIMFCVGLIALGQFVAMASKAVTAGYGWGVVLETAADERGDTGALIAGGREYAELAPEARSAMRRNRVIAAVLRVVAGLVPVVGYFFGVLFFARSSNGPTIVLWSSLLLSLTLLASSRIIWRLEERQMREPRRRLRTATARPSRTNLAGIWMGAFEQVRSGQPLGAGSTSHQRPVKFAAGVAIVGSALIGVLLFLGFSLTSLIRISSESNFGWFENSIARVNAIRRMAAYRVVPDTSISAVRAGQALHAIMRNGPGGRLMRYEKAPVLTIPPQPQRHAGTDPFIGANANWKNEAFRRARRGFTVPERDFLRATADNTALEEFRVFARAPALDLGAVLWDLESGAKPSWMELPTPRFGPVRAAANANAAQAALDLAVGRTQDAERRLKENISAGFLLIHEGRMFIENLVGAAIVRDARTSLSAMYEALGRAADVRFLSAETDPVTNVPNSRGRTRVSAEESERYIRSVMLDTTALRGLRWEMLLMPFAMEPCTDMRQVVFGPDDEHRATLAAARKALVRRPSDSLLFTLADWDKVHRVTAEGARGRAIRSTLSVGRAMRVLTGNRHLESCLSVFGTN